MVNLRHPQAKRYALGFTLIEIVLVLAIAGLILVIVFLAVSGAQRSRRDHQRKNDVAQMVGDVLSYASNNNGIAPNSQVQLNDLRDHYITTRMDPKSGQPYTMVFRNIGSPHSDVPPVGTIYYQQGHWCNTGPGSRPDRASDPIAGDDNNLSKFVLWSGLEAGGLACFDNGQD